MAALAGRAFETLFASLDELEREPERRMVVVAFTRLLTCSQLPPSLVPMRAPMFRQVVHELGAIAESGGEGEDDDDDDLDDMEGTDDDDENENNSDDDDGGGTKKGPRGGQVFRALAVPEGGYDEEDDCVNAQDEEYLSMLAEFEKNQVGHSTIA
jgi:hypothetical protein